MTRPFVMEAWPTGTRLRALRHALRYRAALRAAECKADNWLDSWLAMVGKAARLERERDALRARVAVLEAAVDRTLDDSAAGCNNWRAALREARDAR